MKKFILVLTILAGLLILLPHVQYQPYLAQGDHGRDLYCFQQTSEGKTPYRDTMWLYGPLMPYYYALFFKFLGNKIQSILIGEMILKLFAGIFLFLSIRLMTSSKWAVLAALWFWSFHTFFFFTYNHTGGIMFLLSVVYFLFRYIDTQQKKFLYWGLFSTFLLAFVKINYGFAALGTFIVCVFIIDKVNKVSIFSKKIFYLSGILLLPIMIFLGYLIFINGLPAYIIRQSFPYLNIDHQHNLSAIKSLEIFFKNLYAKIMGNWQNGLLAVLIILSAVQTFLLMLKEKTLNPDNKKILFAIITLILFYITMSHEFLFSGVLYRIAWAQHFGFMLIFILLFSGTRSLKNSLRFLLYFLLLIIILSKQHFLFNTLKYRHQPQKFLAMNKANIYVGNSLDWIKTVSVTTEFLEKNLAENETFLVLPYEPLYYFLTDKASPVWQLAFFQFRNIPQEQEEKMISDLNTKGVNYIVMSNRIKSNEPGLGSFGETHCRLLNQYIQNNFQVVAKFGDWINPAGWAWNHGILILKRVP